MEQDEKVEGLVHVVGLETTLGGVDQQSQRHVLDQLFDG